VPAPLELSRENARLAFRAAECETLYEDDDSHAGEAKAKVKVEGEVESGVLTLTLTSTFLISSSDP
jgi:hypothetical protein